MAESAEIYLSKSCAAASNPSVIKETDDDVYFRACLQDGDSLNRNNKIYPTHLIEQALKNELIQEQIRLGTWYGEANHPLDQRLERQLWIDMQNVCHTIRSVDRKGNRFYGEILTTVNENGKLLKGAVKQNSILSFSMRGIHSLKKEGTHLVVTALKIMTYDNVPIASHRCAVMCPASESASLKEDDVKLTIDRSTINKIMASEGAGCVGMVEDLLDAEVTSSHVQNGVVRLQSSAGIVGFKPSRKLTNQILHDLF